ncbi:hypothetical protein JCM11251_001111 [Rhodosporidiobolus azoricus]
MSCSRVARLLSTSSRLRPTHVVGATFSAGCPACSSLLTTQPAPVRPFSTSRAVLLPPKKQVSKGVLRDEDIPYQKVVIVDPATKSLLPPSTISSLLASLDRSRYLIQLVDPSHDPPICRLVDKKEQYTKAREKKAKEVERSKAPSSAASGPPREVHFTWGVSAHDLGHKLKKGKEFLAKGGRVLVCLTDKSGSVKASNELKGQVIREVQKALEGSGMLQGRPSFKNGATILEFKPEPAK